MTEKLATGEIVDVQIDLLPIGLVFHSGEQLRFIVEAVEKPRLKNSRKTVRNLASQNRVEGDISPSGMVNVPLCLPRASRRGVFLQPR